MNGTNLDLWNRLCETDPAHCKSFRRPGGFAGTAINGTYIIRRLTEAFGPCGIGWRFVVEEERVDEGHTLSNGDRARVHVVRGHIDYRNADEWHSTGPQFGQTMYVLENRTGVHTDEEAPKKSITDCLSKCAVLVGIGADVHLGLFDDNKYVNDRQAAETARLKQTTQRAEQELIDTRLAELTAVIDDGTEPPWLDDTIGWGKPDREEWNVTWRRAMPTYDTEDGKNRVWSWIRQVDMLMTKKHEESGADPGNLASLHAEHLRIKIIKAYVSRVRDAVTAA